MDDNLDIYDKVDTLKECQYVYPGKQRQFFDFFSRHYTVAIQTLDPPLYEKALEIIERDHSKLDIICGNLKINEKESAVSCISELMENKIREGLSLTALELETQKLLGVLVIAKRDNYSNIVPERTNEGMDDGILFIEETRCILINRTLEKMINLGWAEGPYLEVCAICGARGTSDFSNIEQRMIFYMLKMALGWKIIYSAIVITGYKKHQDVLKSLGFVKMAEIAYATINRKLEKKIFWNVGASPTIMCLCYRLDHIRHLRPREPPTYKKEGPRPHRFNFWYS